MVELDVQGCAVECSLIAAVVEGGICSHSARNLCLLHAVIDPHSSR